MRNNEAQREMRKKDKLERELKQTKADLDAKASDIKAMQTQIERYKQDIQKLEQQVKEQRVRLSAVSLTWWCFTEVVFHWGVLSLRWYFTEVVLLFLRGFFLVLCVCVFVFFLHLLKEGRKCVI